MMFKYMSFKGLVITLHQVWAFTNYAPQSWNTLPPAIRTTTDRREFKMLLKTNFFTLSYPSFIFHHSSGALSFF